MAQDKLILDTASILAWLQDEQDKQIDKIDEVIFTISTANKVQGEIIAADPDFLLFENVIWVGNPKILEGFHRPLR